MRQDIEIDSKANIERRGTFMRTNPFSFLKTLLFPLDEKRAGRLRPVSKRVSDKGSELLWL